MGKRTRTRIGILGIAVAIPSDDEDFEEECRPARRARYRRQGTAAGQDDAVVAEEDLPLAARIGSRRSGGARGSAASSAQRAQHECTAQPDGVAPFAAEDGSCSAGPSGWGTQLPTDLLRSILRMACAETALPAAAAVSCVCRLWRDVAKDTPQIWAHLNLNIGPAKGGSGRTPRPTDAILTSLARKGRLSETVSLHWANAPRLSGAGVLALATACPNIHTLDISSCPNVDRAKVMLQVLAALPALTSFNISHTILEPSSSGTDNVLKAALSARGTGQACGLRVLRAAGCPRLSNGTLRALYADAAPATPARNPSASAPSNSGTSASTTAAANTSAPRRLAALREIDLTDSARVSSRLVLHLEKLQRTAPGLEVLRMNGVGGLFGFAFNTSAAPPLPAPATDAIDGSAAGSAAGAHAGCASGNNAISPVFLAHPGFPELRVCELSSICNRGPTISFTERNTGFSYLTDAMLTRLLHASCHLHTLDLSGAANLTPAALRRIPAGAPLRVLRLCRSGLSCDGGLAAVAEGFSATLEVLDASGSAHVSDGGLRSLHTCSALTTLDLRGAGITDTGLRNILSALAAPSPAQGNAHAPSAVDGGASTATGTHARAPAAGGGRLSHVDVDSCRSMERATRHAAAQGLRAVMQHMGLS